MRRARYAFVLLAVLAVGLAAAQCTTPSGPRGLPGAAGPAGATGEPGPAGEQGAAGATGAVGPAGATGATGPVGATGATGAAGPTGATGAAGPAGATGPAGTNGTDGLDGATGAAGPTGETGAAGAAGRDGINGTDGADGDDGSNGADGAVGETGAAGDDGANGADGATGPAGRDGINGTNGIDGADGAQGPAGLDGADGRNGSDGSMGSQGIAGPAGTNGRPFMGFDGHGNVNDTNLQLFAELAITANKTLFFYVVVDDVRSSNASYSLYGDVSRHLISWDHDSPTTEWRDWGLFNGVDGAQGPEGAQGPTGAQGPSGINGVDGADGAAGATGDVGPTGATGETGPTGATGATGPAGRNGTDGSSFTGFDNHYAINDINLELLAQSAIVTGKKVVYVVVTTDDRSNLTSFGLSGNMERHLVSWSYGSPIGIWHDWGLFIAMDGATGATGTTGATGPAGPAGTNGTIIHYEVIPAALYNVSVFDENSDTFAISPGFQVAIDFTVTGRVVAANIACVVPIFPGHSGVLVLPPIPADIWPLYAREYPISVASLGANGGEPGMLVLDESTGVFSLYRTMGRTGFFTSLTLASGFPENTAVTVSWIIGA